MTPNTTNQKYRAERVNDFQILIFKNDNDLESSPVLEITPDEIIEWSNIIAKKKLDVMAKRVMNFKAMDKKSE